MFYLDTCTCIELLRGRMPRTLQLMQELPPSRFAVPSVVVGELLTGVEKSKDPQRGQRVTERFLSAFEVVPFDEDCARVYAKTRAQLEREGRVIGRNDLLIASTALAKGATIVTNNVSEFVRVPGLRVECWEEAAF